MESIKTCKNVEFDVIYDDGTRRRVKEGVLIESSIGQQPILHNATDEPAVWFSAVESLLLAIDECGAMPALIKYIMTGDALQKYSSVFPLAAMIFGRGSK